MLKGFTPGRWIRGAPAAEPFLPRTTSTARCVPFLRVARSSSTRLNGSSSICPPRAGRRAAGVVLPPSPAADGPGRAQGDHATYARGGHAGRRQGDGHGDGGAVVAANHEVAPLGRGLLVLLFLGAGRRAGRSTGGGRGARRGWRGEGGPRSARR